MGHDVWRLVWCHVVRWIGGPAFRENWLAPFAGYLPTKLHSISFWQPWILTVSTVWRSWASHDKVSLSAVESTIRRPTVNPPQWSPKCSRCWSMPANTCTPTTWRSLWPARTRNRNCVKVMVVGVTYETTSSALIWPALEGSIRWVRLGEHQVMICRQSSSSGIYDTRRTVSAAVALRTVWMLNVMLVTAQVSKCCLRSCTCCCNTESSWHISSLSSNVSCCLGHHNVLCTSDDKSTVRLCWVSRGVQVSCWRAQLNLTNCCMDGMVYFRTVLLVLFRAPNYMYESVILSVSLIGICLRCLKSQNLCAAW